MNLFILGLVFIGLGVAIGILGLLASVFFILQPRFQTFIRLCKRKKHKDVDTRPPGGSGMFALPTTLKEPLFLIGDQKLKPFRQVRDE
jgi:hypothetical protein